jgi:hypothetical protein
MVGLSAVALGVSLAYLIFGGISVRDDEQAIACPAAGPGFGPLHCWRSGSTLEMNAYGQRPLDLAAVNSLARSLAATKQDAALYEAIVLDTTDSTVASYSNARLFVLQRADLTGWGDRCLSEHRAKQQEVQSHRIGFYRFSAQQSPAVNAFFLQDTGKNGESGYEVVDLLHAARTMPYVRPDDLQAAESAYLDRAAADLGRLNQDLDRETQTPSPAGSLTTMRQDYERIKADRAAATCGVPRPAAGALPGKLRVDPHRRGERRPGTERGENSLQRLRAASAVLLPGAAGDPADRLPLPATTRAELHG